MLVWPQVINRMRRCFRLSRAEPRYGIVLLPLGHGNAKQVSSGLLRSMWLKSYLDTWYLCLDGFWGNSGTYCSPFTRDGSFFWKNLSVVFWWFFVHLPIFLKNINKFIKLIRYNLIFYKYLQNKCRGLAFIFTVTLEHTLLLLCLRSSLVF